MGDRPEAYGPMMSIYSSAFEVIWTVAFHLHDTAIHSHSAYSLGPRPFAVDTPESPEPVKKVISIFMKFWCLMHLEAFRLTA